jgi:ankyrin repeat protein
MTALPIHDAYQRGDLAELKRLLGDPGDFPNCPGPTGYGENILEYAIYHSPLSFIRQLLDMGADPNYGDHADFPSLIAALSAADRTDRYEIIEMLLSFGADVQQRGINDYTPLHFAACIEDVRAMELLIAHGADVEARTHIDDYATPLEEMEILGRKKSADFLRMARLRKR